MKTNFKGEIEWFDRWSETYERSFLQSFLFGPVHAKMLDLVAREGPARPPGSILDVGCGTGRLLRAASSRWPAARLFGVDPSTGMLSEARRHFLHAAFQVAPAEALPFPGGSVDLVMSSISFHHWADHGKALQEIARVLRPGGWLCLADHIFLPARLFGENVQSREQIWGFIRAAGLTVRKHRMWRLRYVLITLAQKSA